MLRDLAGMHWLGSLGSVCGVVRVSRDYFMTTSGRTARTV